MTERPDTGGSPALIEQSGQAPAIPLERRVELLRGIPAFSSLSAAALRMLATVLQEERFGAGEVVVAQGEAASKLYVIAEGRTEVSSQAPDGPTILSTQEPGELFGELSLLALVRRGRRVTVTALTDLLVLTIDVPPVEALVRQYPEARTVFEASGEVMLVARFLKRASPFATLSTEITHRLATRLEYVSAAPGEVILHQGEQGTACYLSRAGSVEVVVGGEGGEERRIAVLPPGVFFGETSLLTVSPNTATVRALEPCDLLVLRRADLLEAIGADRQVGLQFVELMNLRDRPRQVPGIEAHTRTTAEGEPITTLKDPERGIYYRLSPQGWFLWQRMDGENTLRDLTMAYLDQFGSFSPQAVAELVGGLAQSGFVEARALREDVARSIFGPSRWNRFIVAARRIMEWRVALENVDPTITRLYRGGVRLLYTRVGQVLLAVLAVLGIPAFVLTAVRVGETVANNGVLPALLIFFIPGYILPGLVRQAGHAFTTKAFGHEVVSMGVGWYWFAPVVYVDTSDMWLAGRWPRVAVSLGGMYASFLLGSISALIAAVSPSDVLTAVLWELAFFSYVEVLINLNPLLEYDGYFVLMDLLDRPNLRARCLRWLGRDMPQAVRERRGLASHRLELIYGLASVLYVVAVIVVTFVSYRLLLEGWLSHLFSHSAAVLLAWMLAAITAVLGLASIFGELRGIRLPRR